MLVGDIYGGRDYTGIGLSANTIASSFGKVINTSMVSGGSCFLLLRAAGPPLLVYSAELARAGSLTSVTLCWFPP